MKRRHFLGVLSGAAIGLPKAVAQKPLPRVGFLASGAAASINSDVQVRTIKRGLEANGLVEGRDYIFEARFSGGRYEKFPQLARELAQAGVSVILANTIASVQAARNLVPPVPVVMMAIHDPVGMGLIASLARPGGHITGIASLGEDLTPKLLEFQRAILPKATSIALLYNPANPTNQAFGLTGSERPYRRAGAHAPAADFLDESGLRPVWRPDRLWRFARNALLSGGVFREANPRRRQRERPSRRAAVASRIVDQPEDGQGARPHHPRVAARHRR
jgi:hypothetical protein